MLEGIHDAHAYIFKEMCSIISYLDSKTNQAKVIKGNSGKEIEILLETSRKYEKENEVYGREKKNLIFYNKFGHFYQNLKKI